MCCAYDVPLYPKLELKFCVGGVRPPLGFMCAVREVAVGVISGRVGVCGEVERRMGIRGQTL